jgi:hypothetical protein
LQALFRPVEGIFTVASFYCCYHCYCWRPFVSDVLTGAALLAFLLLPLFLRLLKLMDSLLLLACLFLLTSLLFSGVPDAVGIHDVPNVPWLMLLASPQYPSYMLLLAYFCKHPCCCSFALLKAFLLLLVFIAVITAITRSLCS